MQDFVRDPRPIVASLVSGAGHTDAVIAEVLKARVSVWIATANLKAMMIESPGLRRRRSYRSILEALAELAELRVDLRILHASLPSRPFRNELDKHPVLFKGGLELRLCPRVHFKAVIIDGRLVYLGSANWTGAGLGAKSPDRRNFELGFVSQDAQLLDEVQGLFDTIWRGDACGRCKRRDLCEAPLDTLTSCAV